MQDGFGRRAVMAGAALAATPVLNAAPVSGATPPLRLARLPGVALAYWDTGGDGAAILLLHPGTGSHAVFERQVAPFAAAGHRVIGYSRRGYLGSEPGPDGDPGSASDDLERLADHLRLDRFHAVGAAQGAIVALDFALSRGTRLLSLTLACTIMGVRDPAYAALSASLRPEGFAAMPATFRELGPAYRAADPAGTARWLELEHAAIPGRRVRQRETNAITWAALGALRVPTLLIGGDADLWAPPPIYRAYAAAIPGSESLILPECGHSAHWEQPAAFNAAVLAFIGRHA